MPYIVRNGRLHFDPTISNGPCARYCVGRPGRRLLTPTYHATKGTRAPGSEAGIAWFLTMPPGPPKAPPNGARIERNKPRASVPGGLRRAQKGAAA